MSWPWSQLGLPGPASLSEIRHAYAEKLKTTHPEEDPEGFQRLHSAYQLASRMARRQGKREMLQREQPPRREQPPVRPPEPSGPPEFDYEELLKERSETPRRPQEEAEQDFDFEELLQSGEDAPPPPPPPQSTEQDFDFEQLLQFGEDAPPPPPPQPEEREFDYERLFAEGEAERAEARRRRGEERRKARERWKAQEQARERERRKAQEWTQKREQWHRSEQRETYEQQRRDRFNQEQFKWQNTETILHTIEMLCHSQAGREAWEKFFQSPLFQQMKGSIDLIFGLEDFVSAHPDLPSQARIALFLAYGFDKGAVRPELQPLYQMLLPAWEAEQGEARQKKRSKLASYAAGILLGPVLLVLFATGWLWVILVLLIAFFFVRTRLDAVRKNVGGGRTRNLKLLWLAALGIFTYVCYDQGWGWKFPLCVFAVGLAYWVLREVFRLGRQEGMSKGMPPNKRDERWLIALAATMLAVGMLMLFLPELQEKLSAVRASQDPREQVCRYLEEDYGIPFQSIYNRTELERYTNVFAPEGDLGKMFLAGPAEDRDKKTGALGYTTNYPEMMVRWTLKDFARRQDLPSVDSPDQGLENWNTTGTFLITLDFCGDGEIITQLGELLEEMAQEDWYQVRPPEFEVVLCSGPFQEGRLVLSRCQSGGEAFDAQAVRALYESDFGHACCAQLLQDSGLDRNFVGDGAKLYSLASGGMAEMKGQECFRLYGLDGDGRTAMEYYVSTEGGSVYCVPGGYWEAGGTEDGLQFYRVVHVEATGGMFTLFYPWLSAS